MILAMFPGFEPQLLAKDVRSSQPKGVLGTFLGTWRSDNDDVVLSNSTCPQVFTLASLRLGFLIE